jgi:purine-binding chemotaxis protein CheW
MDDANRLIVFTLKESKYALYLRNVAEVVEPPRIFPMPNVPLFFLGIMNFHGNLVSLLDLAHFLLNAPRNQQGKVLVLDTGMANLAFWVDAVEIVGSADVVLEEFGSNETLVEKVLMMADGEVKMLSLEKLLEQLEETLSGGG